MELTKEDLLPYFKNGIDVGCVLFSEVGVANQVKKSLNAHTTLFKSGGLVTLTVWSGSILEKEYSVLDFEDAINHYNKIIFTY